MSVQQDLVFDVGFHEGQDTDFYLRKGYRVIAFEANPALVQLGAERFQQAIDEGRLTIVSGAVAPKSHGEHVLLYTNPISTWNTIDPAWAARRQSAKANAIEVERVDMDTVISTYGMPLYMKIDIEGADRYVLATLKNFEKKPTHISIESEKHDFSKLLEETRLLLELGYRRFRAVQQQWMDRTSFSVRTIDGRQLNYRFRDGASGPFGEDLDQPYTSFDELVDTYRLVYRQYRLFGDDSLLRRLPAGGTAVEMLSRLVRRPLPGWYDTHATFLEC